MYIGILKSGLVKAQNLCIQSKTSKIMLKKNCQSHYLCVPVCSLSANGKVSKDKLDENLYTLSRLSPSITLASEGL